MATQGSDNKTPVTAPAKAVEKMVKAKVAPRKSIMISNTVTALPGDTVEFSEKEMKRLKADGFVVDFDTKVEEEEVEPGATVKQASKDTVTIERPRDGRPAFSSVTK